MNRGGTGVKKKADNNKKDIDHYEEHWSQEEVHRAKQHMTVLIGTLKGRLSPLLLFLAVYNYCYWDSG